MSNNFISNDTKIQEWMNINCNRLSCNELNVRGGQLTQYVQVTQKINNNSTDFLSVFNDTNARGTRTLEANYFNAVGRYLSCKMGGWIVNTASAGLSYIDVLLDDFKIATIIAPLSVNPQNWEIQFDIVHIGNGLFICTGKFTSMNGVDGGNRLYQLSTGQTPVYIANYLDALTLDVQTKWSVANPSNALGNIYSIITKDV